MPRSITRSVLLAFTLAPSALAAQNFSGLEGKELSAVQDLEIIASNGVLSLFGPGRNIDGKIDRVLVRTDLERRLVFVLSYHGFPRGDFKATVQDQTKRASEWLDAPRVEADTGARQVEITVSLDTAHTPPGTTFESTYLRLGFNKEGKSLGKEFMFLLPKQWQLAIRPENVVVKVYPVAIGRATHTDAGTVNRYRASSEGGTTAPPPPPPAPPPPPQSPPGSTGAGVETRAFALTGEFGNRLVLDIHPAAAGKIFVEASWPEPVGLALILNGPGQVGYFARQDGRSPLRLEYAITPDQLAKGQEWKLSVVNFSRAPSNGTVRVTYPASTGIILARFRAPRVLIPTTTVMHQQAVFTAGLTSAQRDSGLSGPGNDVIDLLGELRTDVNFDLQRVSEILGIKSQIYHDRKVDSGTYYFVPNRYHLVWEPGSHFGMDILYRTDTPNPDSAKVQMSTHLHAGVGTMDLSIAAQLLQAYVHKHNLGFSQLRLVRMPLDTTPRLSLSDDLHHLYDIPSDRVVIRDISPELGEAQVDWVTDAHTATDMQTELVAHGLSGQAVLDPQGHAVPAIPVPIDISLRDPGTYGLLTWRRGDVWRNETRYPITVKRLHALMLDFVDGVPTVLSWSLGDAVVQPQARLFVDTAVVQAWVETLSLRTWIEYTVAEDCESCDQLALADIRGGASYAERQMITFRTLTPLADIGASALTVDVRSRFLRPGANAVQDAPPLILNADNHEFSGASIFPPAPVAGADTTTVAPFFEYRLTAVMKDGTEHVGATWIPSTQTSVFIGSAQIQQSLGSLPGSHNP